jgi:hypothetical protein
VFSQLTKSVQMPELQKEEWWRREQQQQSSQVTNISIHLAISSRSIIDASGHVVYQFGPPEYPGTTVDPLLNHVHIVIKDSRSYR